MADDKVCPNCVGTGEMVTVDSFGNEKRSSCELCRGVGHYKYRKVIGTPQGLTNDKEAKKELRAYAELITGKKLIE